MKPRILLSASPNNANYINAVKGCGGIPFASYLPEVDTAYDGLILCGGVDIHPNYYRQEINGTGEIDIKRDVCEFALAKAFIEAGKPVLGICRGLQLLNVYFGGTLIQDLNNACEHTSKADYDLIHPVQAVPGSVVHSLYGNSFVVNSSHHQAIGRLGDGLTVTMTAENPKVIEGVAHETLPVLAVQWHPERMCFKKERSDTVNGASLIQYFIDLCKAASHL